MSPYWEERGQSAFTYNGETYYTITPIGFYHQRRSWLLTKIRRELGRLDDKAKVLDFGCGDGAYAIRFAAQYPNLDFWGCDISQSMIDQAQFANQQQDGRCVFTKIDDGIPFSFSFDLIFVIAVWAHIMDKQVQEKIAKDLIEHLGPDGRLILVEITGKTPKKGPSWQRLPKEYYRTFFMDQGLNFVTEESISYPVYNLVGAPFFALITKLFFKNDPIQANGHPLFQKGTDLFMKFSQPFNRFLPATKSNTFYVFSK